METNNSTAAAITEAGHVTRASGKVVRAFRTTNQFGGVTVRVVDARGGLLTSHAGTIASFVPLAAEAVDLDHGIALIEAAGHGVRILVQIDSDQHDAAFEGAEWPAVDPDDSQAAIDVRKVIIGMGRYQVTRVTMPSGEHRRFARQFAGERPVHDDAWLPVEVVPVEPTWDDIEAAHVADAEAAEYAARDILPEHEQALINAAADEVRRIAEDADREAAEQLAELDWGTSPAAILAEPDVDTSGCSNPWHRTAALYGRRACPECPPFAVTYDPFPSLAANIDHGRDDDTAPDQTCGPTGHEHYVDGDGIEWCNATAEHERPVETVELPSGHPFKVGQLVEVDTRHLATEPERWERGTVYAVGGLLGGRNVEVEYAAGGVSPVAVARMRPATGCQHPGELGRIACGWGHCRVCGSALRTANGRTPELDAQGRFMYAENGDRSASIAETVQLPGGEGDDSAEVDVPATRAPAISERMALTLRYFDDPSPATLAPLRALRGQHVGTAQALARRGLTESSDVWPHTVLTALGRQVLADYDRTDPQT